MKIEPQKNVYYCVNLRKTRETSNRDLCSQYKPVNMISTRKNATKCTCIFSRVYFVVRVILNFKLND